MIKSVSLRNFKKHAALDVEFSDGLTLISGPNYSGKSTILHAILFAFGGPSLVPGGAKRMVRRGESAKTLKVALEFLCAETVFRIERGVSSAKLYRDEEMIAVGSAAVSAELEQVTGVPARFFSYLKYAAQGETQALLTLGAGKLHEVLEHVSGASLVNRVIGLAASRGAQASEWAAAVGPAPDIAEIEQHLAETLAQHKARYQQHASHKAEADRLAEVRHKIEQDLQGVLASNAKILEHEQAVRGLGAQIAQAEERHGSETSELAVLEQRAAEVGGLVTEYEAARAVFDERARVENELKAARQKAADTGQEVQLLRDAAEDAQVQVAALPRAEVHRALEECARWDQYLKSATKELDALRQAKESMICPACQRPYEGAGIPDLCRQIEEAEKVCAETRAAAEAAHSDLAVQEARANKIRQACATLDMRVQDFNRALQLLENWKSAVTSSETALARLPASVSEEDLHALKVAASHAQQIVGRCAAVRDSVARTNAHLSSLREQMRLAMESAPEGVYEDPSLLKEAVKFGSAKEVSFREGAAEIFAEIQVLAERAAHLEAAVDRAKADAARLDEFRRKASVCTDLAKYLRENRDRFMGDLWAGVTGQASELASLCTGGAISGIGRSEDGAFFYEEDGFREDVVSASGAQRSIMSIGIQMALGTSVAGLDFLLADEPSAGMDAAHAGALAAALAGAGKQVIMISHMPMDSTVAATHISLGGSL